MVATSAMQPVVQSQHHVQLCAALHAAVDNDFACPQYHSQVVVNTSPDPHVQAVGSKTSVSALMHDT